MFNLFVVVKLNNDYCKCLNKNPIKYIVIFKV